MQKVLSLVMVWIWVCCACNALGKKEKIRRLNAEKKGILCSLEMFESSLRCCRLALRCVSVCFRFISVTVWILWGEGEKQVWCGGGEVRRRGVRAPAEDACHSCWCLCRPRRRNLEGPRSSATTSFVEPPLLSPLRLLLILLLNL